jgi:hypothetical protein
MTRTHLARMLATIVATLAFQASHSASGFDAPGIVGYQYEVQTFGFDSVRILPTAEVTYQRAYDHSNVDMLGGMISWSDFYDSSSTNIFSGTTVGHIDLHENATANVYGGNISWFKLYSSSKAVLKTVDTLSWLLFSGQSEAHLYGSDFQYSYGHLSGKWANGSSFEFWALNSATLADPLADRSQPPPGLKLHVVPEPGSSAIVVCGVVMLLRRRRTDAAK